jgi:hypothetical protein
MTGSATTSNFTATTSDFSTIIYEPVIPDRRDHQRFFYGTSTLSLWMKKENPFSQRVFTKKVKKCTLAGNS